MGVCGVLLVLGCIVQAGWLALASWSIYERAAGHSVQGDLISAVYKNIKQVFEQVE